jgi:hypothetical protein
MDGVTRLLAEKRVFPNDRDVKGNSLLGVRLIEAKESNLIEVNNAL